MEPLSKRRWPLRSAPGRQDRPEVGVQKGIDLSTIFNGSTPGNTGRSHGRSAGNGLLWAAEHRFYRAGESDRPTWRGSAGTTHVGHGPAGSTTAGTLGMVASLLSFCAPPCNTTDGAHAAARARGQTGGTALPAAYPSDGSGENQPTMDNAGNPVLSFAADAMLHTVSVNEGRRRPMKWQGQLGEGESTVEAAGLKDEVPYLDGRMRKKSARNTFAGAGRIVHHILWQYPRPNGSRHSVVRLAIPRSVLDVTPPCTG
jgi:hypothetical protein